MTGDTKTIFRIRLIHILRCDSVIGLSIILFIVLSAFGAFGYWQAEKQLQGKTSLRFETANLPVAPKADLENSFPSLAGAAIDIDGDGVEEFFLGGCNRQDYTLFAFRDRKFETLDSRIVRDKVDATHGAAALDIDDDGDTEMLVSGEKSTWSKIENNAFVFCYLSADFSVSGSGLQS